MLTRSVTFEARVLGLALLLAFVRCARLDRLEFLDPGFDPFLGRLQQVFADVDLARPRLKLLPARLQPLKDRALAAE